MAKPKQTGSITCPYCEREFEASAAFAVRVQLEVAEQVEAAEQRARKEAEQEVRAELGASLREKDKAKAAAEAKLAGMKQTELELRRRKAELEDAKRELELNVQQRVDAEREAIRSKAKEQVRAELAATLREKDEEKAAVDEKLARMKQTELELRKSKAELEDSKRELELNVQQRVDAEREAIRSKAKEQVRAELAASLRAKDEEKAAVDAQLAGMKQTELELRKSKAELEDSKRELELSVQRRVDAERENIRAQAVAHEREDAALRLRDKDTLIQQLRASIDEMKQRSEQGSMQVQGESQELVLSERLRMAFPSDSFEDVAKGAEGADVLHRVRDELGRECGRILWESKRTKNWSENWLAKLREDQRQAGATCAAIVSQALPPDAPPLQEREGVWVSGFMLAVPMASLLRRALLDADGARRARTGRETKTELVYEYLTGPDFQRRVQGVVEAWQGMHDDLDKEKRAMRAIWSKRESLLGMALQGMLGIHRDVKGIAGIDVASLPMLESPVADLEAIAPAHGSKDDAAREEEFIRELTESGGRAGNVSLRQSLDMDIETYDRIKLALVAAGRITLGRGRGGSVVLTDLNTGDSNSADEQAEAPDSQTDVQW